MWDPPPSHLCIHNCSPVISVTCNNFPMLHRYAFISCSLCNGYPSHFGHGLPINLLPVMFTTHPSCNNNNIPALLSSSLQPQFSSALPHSSLDPCVLLHTYSSGISSPLHCFLSSAPILEISVPYSGVDATISSYNILLTFNLSDLHYLYTFFLFIEVMKKSGARDLGKSLYSSL